MLGGGGSSFSGLLGAGVQRAPWDLAGAGGGLALAQLLPRTCGAAPLCQVLGSWWNSRRLTASSVTIAAVQLGQKHGGVPRILINLFSDIFSSLDGIFFSCPHTALRGRERWHRTQVPRRDGAESVVCRGGSGAVYLSQQAESCPGSARLRRDLSQGRAVPSWHGSLSLVLHSLACPHGTRVVQQGPFAPRAAGGFAGRASPVPPQCRHL